MHMKLLDPENLARGTDRQKQAHAALKKLGIFEKLVAYGPVLAGTIPIDVDIESSDIDVILAAENLEELGEKLTESYGRETGFRLTHELVNNQPTLIARFEAAGFPFELFAQNRSVLSQPAVLHMLVEARLLAFAPSEARSRIRELKRAGLKTEPAFAQCFEIEGDPYEELLKIARTTDREILQVAHRFHFRIH